jgi:hypothetical protein
MRKFLVGVLLTVLPVAVFGQTPAATVQVNQATTGFQATNGKQLGFAVDALLFAYGDDSHDDTAALAAAIAYGLSTGKYVDLGRHTYKCSAGFTVDIAHTCLRHGTLDFSGIAYNSGITALTITTSATDPNQMNAIHGQNFFEGMYLIGPTGVGGNTTAITLLPETISALPWIQMGVLKNGGILGFNKGFVTAGGGWGWTWDNFNVTGTSGVSPVNPIYLGGGLNTGEAWKFSNLQIVNFVGTAITLASTGGDLYLDKSSIDGSSTFVEVASGNKAFLSGHFEAPAVPGGSNWLFKVDSGADGLITIHDSEIVIDPAANYSPEIAYSGQTSGTTPFTTSGIILRDCFVNMQLGAYLPDYIVAGPGPAHAKGLYFPGNSSVIPLSAQSNLLQDGNFAANSYDWSSTGTFARTAGTGPTPYGSTANGYFGKLTNSTVATAQITSQFFPCTPGDTLCGQFYAQTVNMVTSGSNWICNIVVYDSSQTHILLTKVIGLGSTDIASWTRFTGNGQNAVVPSGGAFAQMYFLLNVSSSTTANFEVGAINFQIYKN